MTAALPGGPGSAEVKADYPGWDCRAAASWPRRLTVHDLRAEECTGLPGPATVGVPTVAAAGALGC